MPPFLSSVTELQPDYNDYDESSTPAPEPRFSDVVDTTVFSAQPTAEPSTLSAEPSTLSAEPSTLSAEPHTLSAEPIIFPAADLTTIKAESGVTEVDSDDSTPFPEQNVETTTGNGYTILLHFIYYSGSKLKHPKLWEKL